MPHLALLAGEGRSRQTLLEGFAGGCEGGGGGMFMHVPAETAPNRHARSTT